MSFDDFMRRGMAPRTAEPVRTIPAPFPGPGRETFVAGESAAELHERLAHASTGGAVARMLEIDAEARRSLQPQRLTWFQQLFPTPAHQALVRAEGQIAETEAEFRVRTLRVLRGVELKLMEDGLNAARVQHSTRLRGIVAEHVYAEIRRLVDAFTVELERFMESAVGRIERAQALPYEALREAAYTTVADDIALMRSLRETLVAQFKATVAGDVTA